MKISEKEAFKKLELLRQKKTNSRQKCNPRQKTILTKNADGTKKILQGPGHLLCAQMHRGADRKDIVGIEVVKPAHNKPSLLKLTYKDGITIEKDIPRNIVNLEVVMQPYGQPARLKVMYKNGLTVQKEIPKNGQAEIKFDALGHAYVVYEKGLQMITFGPNHLNLDEMIQVLKKGKIRQGVVTKKGPQVNIRQAASHFGNLVHCTKVGHNSGKSSLHA